MVDGLEKEWGERVQVIRLSIATEVGISAARRYRVSAVPTFVVTDGTGKVLLSSAGGVPKTVLRDAVESALVTP